MNKRVAGERDESPGTQGSSSRPETSLMASWECFLSCEGLVLHAGAGLCVAIGKAFNPAAMD